jgi:hypothetical protein
MFRQKLDRFGLYLTTFSDEFNSLLLQRLQASRMIANFTCSLLVELLAILMQVHLLKVTAARSLADSRFGRNNDPSQEGLKSKRLALF